jgi:hypothetical protein
VREEVAGFLDQASSMHLRSIMFSALFMAAFALPALAQSERAALVDFTDHDKRSEGTVVWSTEQVKTPDGRDNLAIRADVDIPGQNLKPTMVLRRNLDLSTPASHLIDMTFTVPSGFMDSDNRGAVLGVVSAPNELGKGPLLWGTSYKTRIDGKYLVELSEEPVQICENLAALNDNAWLSILLRDAKRKPGVLYSTRNLWFSKGESGQRVFDAVFAAWEKTPAAEARNAVCKPS